MLDDPLSFLGIVGVLLILFAMILGIYQSRGEALRSISAVIQFHKTAFDLLLGKENRLVLIERLYLRDGVAMISSTFLFMLRPMAYLVLSGLVIIPILLLVEHVVS